MQSRTWRSSLVRLAIVWLSVVFPALSAAQTSSSRETPRPGALVGFIAGPDEARLPGVVVTVNEVTSGSAVTVVTGAHGGYRATGLRPGQYELKAELVGFQPQILRGLSLSNGQTREVDFTLALAAYAEAVTVIGATARDSLQATEIRDSTARDIGEALSRVNGFSKVRKGGIGNDVVLHGYHGKDLTVLIDGQKVYGACPDDMDPAVFHADFAEVDHVDVGKGPFDMFNQGSLGGVINVVTRNAAEGLHAELNFSAGSFGYLNPSGTLSYGAGRRSLLGGYSYRSSSPYRDGSGARFTEYANYRSTSAASRAFGANTGWARLLLSPHAGHTIQASYTRQRADHVLYPYLDMDAIADNADRLRVGYERAPVGGPVETLALDAYYTRVSHSMSDEFRTSSIGFMQPYSMTTQADSSIGGGKFQVGLGPVTTGLEVSRRSWSATTSMMANGAESMMADGGQSMIGDGAQSAIPDVTTDSVGVYGSYRRSLGRATQLDLGGRLDWARTAADPMKANTNLYLRRTTTRERRRPLMSCPRGTCGSPIGCPSL